MATTHDRELIASLSINNKKYPLFTGHNFIGRNKKANIVLRDISISQQHALITILCGKIYISDLKSSNSTFIDGTVLIPLHLYEIADQCELKFGTIGATLIIDNIEQSECDRVLIESQCDDAIFGLDTQLQYEAIPKRVTTPLLQPILEISEDQDADSKSKSINQSTTLGNNNSLTQLFWDTRKVFQPIDSQFPYSEAVISKSDSDTDDDFVTIHPTKNVNVLNTIDEEGIQNTNNSSPSNCNFDPKNNVPIENECCSQPSQVLKVKRKSTMQVINSDSDSDLEDNIESSQKESKTLKSTQDKSSSQPIKVKRESTVQMILSDSDSDLENQGGSTKEITSNKTRKDHLCGDKLKVSETKRNSRKLLVNSENINLTTKENLDQRVVKSLGDDPSSQPIDVKKKVNNKIQLSDNATDLEDPMESHPKVQFKENAKYLSNNESIKATKKIDSDSDTDLEDNSKDINESCVFVENITAVAKIMESDKDTDLEDNPFEQPPVITKTRRSCSNLMESDGDTDLDDNSNSEKNNFITSKTSSGIKITETNTYSLDSDNESMEFDLMNTDFNGSINKEIQNSEVDDNTVIKDKSINDDISNDVIDASDDISYDVIEASDDNVTETVKYYKKKVRKSFENKYQGTRSRKESNEILQDLEMNEEANAKEDPQDTTQYITSHVRCSDMFNNTGGTNYDDLSVIPATQDVGENIEISTTDAGNLKSQDKDSQGSFRLGVSEYISHSQEGDKLANNEMGKEDDAKIPSSSQPDPNFYNNEFGDNQELHLAARQQLHCESNVAAVPMVASEEVDGATQQIEDDNNCDDDSIFSKPTQKLASKRTNDSYSETDEDNALFLAPTQKINPRINDKSMNDDSEDENSVFAMATQKIFRNETKGCDNVIDGNSSCSKPTVKLHIDRSREDSARQSTSKQISQRECAEDYKKCNRKSSKVFLENVIDNDIFDLPTQVINNQPDPPEKVDVDLFDLPTQVLDQNRYKEQGNELKNTNDIFDVPTQIVSNIDDGIIDLCTQEMPIDADSPNIIKANTELFDLQTQILLKPHCQKPKNKPYASTTSPQEVKELKEKLEDVSSNNDIGISSGIKKVESISNDKTEMQKLNMRPSGSKINKTDESSKNRTNTFEEEESTRRVTRLKCKKIAVNKSKKNLQDITRKGTIDLNNFEAIEICEDNINEIKRSIINMPDHVDMIKTDNNKPMFCTQEVLQVLTSDNNSEDGKSAKSIMSPNIEISSTKVTRSSKKVGRKDVQTLKHNSKVPLYSTQDVLDVLTLGSTTEDKNDKSASVFIKPKNIPIPEASAKKTPKGRNSKRLSDKQNQPLFSTQEVVNVLAADLKQESDKSDSIFVKPNLAERKTRERVIDSNEKSKKCNKVQLFSTQDVIDVLTSDDAAKNDLDTSGITETLNETNDSLTESGFITGTNINLHSTMISTNIDSTVKKDGDIQSDDDFEDIKTKNEMPSCSNTVNPRRSRRGTSSEVIPKSRKRVTIKDSNLDVLHEISSKASHCLPAQKSLTKKHKFPPSVQDDDDDDDGAEAIDDLKMPSRKTRKVISEPKAESKRRSIKQKTITGILKNTAKTARSTRSTKEPIRLSCNDENHILTDAVVSKITRNSRSNNNNNNVIVDHTNINNPKLITAIPENTHDVIINREINPKRGRPKKNSTCSPSGTILAPPSKRISVEVGTISNAPSDENEPLAIPGTSKETFDDSKKKRLRSNEVTDILASGSLPVSINAKRIRSDSTISDNLTPLSQRSKRQLKPKVVFTMLDSPELESIIRTLGGTVVDSVEACTVLVTASVKRTEKLLMAIGQGKPICSDKWLKECKAQHKFLDPWCHIFRDVEAETRWDFSLEVSLERSQEEKLFQNYTMMLIVNTTQDILKKAIESTGGKCVKNVRKIPENFVIVSVPENQKKFQKFISDDSDVIIVEPEAIFDAVLRQEIRFNMFKLA